MSHQEPNIFRFLSYPEWLTAAFEARREAEPSMTHRVFSEKCGYRSSGAIALIMGGKRRLSEKGARRIAKALSLTPGERDHLVLMVAFERASSYAQRERLLKKMTAAKQFEDEWEGSLVAMDYYRHWYLPVVREIVSLDDFVEDPAWISEKIHFKLTKHQVSLALEELLKLGYLERDSEGRLRPTQAIIATPAEVRSEALKQHQREMMRLASSALDSQAPDRRDMRVTTMAISVAQAARVKALLTQLQKDVLAVVQEDEPIEVAYQLNTQWFALSEPPGDASGTEVE